MRRRKGKKVIYKLEAGSSHTKQEIPVYSQSPK
jgi:hypothetical protein